MPHAIIRRENGRRHEVDFGDAPVRVQIYASEETVEIFIEADFDTLPEERRRFALVNVPRHLFCAVNDLVSHKLILPDLASELIPAPSLFQEGIHNSLISETSEFRSGVWPFS